MTLAYKVLVDERIDQYFNEINQAIKLKMLHEVGNCHGIIRDSSTMSPGPRLTTCPWQDDEKIKGFGKCKKLFWHYREQVG